MIIYTVLFTLEGHSVEQNRYVDMFWIWLRFLEKYGALSESDTVVCLCDTITEHFLKEHKNYIPIQLEFKTIGFDIPKTLTEGAAQRYKILDYYFEKSQSYLYLDVDTICIRSPKVFETSSNTIYVYSEGDLFHGLYMDYTKTQRDLDFLASKGITSHPGFTSGMFLFKESPVLKTFFEDVVSAIQAAGPKGFYTLEQPFFNRVLFDYMYYKESPKLKIETLSKKCMGYNVIRHRTDDQMIFNNMCGEPGHQMLHWYKMLFALVVES